MKHLRWLLCLLAVFALVAAACGNDDTTTGDSAPGSGDSMDDDMDGDMDDSMDDDMDGDIEDDPCEGVSLEATDKGITEDTITVLVMADIGSAFAPGLFQGSIDGVKAWADHVNAEGGLACRQVEVLEHDSAIDPTQTTNGFLVACDDAFALVGTTALSASNTKDLQACEDASGNAIGVPDFAYITTEPAHQCSVVTFATSRPNSECPYEEGPRTVQSQVGAVRYLTENVEADLNGVFLVPTDIASTITATTPQIRGYREAGIVIDAAPSVSGFTPQSQYGAYLQTMREANSNFAYTGSNDESMIKWRSEAVAQGFDSDSVIWMCQLACYTPNFLEQGDIVDGTYVWSWFLPFHETDQNQELADFMDAIDKDFPEAWAAGSWAAGVLMEQVVADIVAESGHNGVTRQAVLDGARTVDSYDVNGWWSPADYTTTQNIMPCFMLMQVQDSEFVRVHPAEEGTLDCDPANVSENTADWITEYDR